MSFDPRTVDTDLVAALARVSDSESALRAQLLAAGLQPTRITLLTDEIPRDLALRRYGGMQLAHTSPDGFQYFGRRTIYENAVGELVIISFTPQREMEAAHQLLSQLAKNSLTEEGFIDLLLSNFDYFFFVWEDGLSENDEVDLAFLQMLGFQSFETGNGGYVIICIDPAVHIQ